MKNYDLKYLEADGGSNERRLLNDLLQYYNKWVKNWCFQPIGEQYFKLANHRLGKENDSFFSLERPVFNESDAVELQLGLTLQQIIDVVTLKGHWKFQLGGKFNF